MFSKTWTFELELLNLCNKLVIYIAENKSEMKNVFTVFKRFCIK